MIALSFAEALCQMAMSLTLLRGILPETLLDKLRLVMATFVYHHSIQELLQQGVDLTKHLYVPEVDPHTEEEGHDQGDYNHIFRRIAQHIHCGGHVNLNYEAFDNLLKD